MNGNVNGYPNYHVTKDGEVINIKTGRVLKPNPTRHGYPQITLCHNGTKKSQTVHRLVALAHVDGDKTLTVNHIDGDKTNNRASNLEWVSYTDNNRHALDNGLRGKISRQDAHIIRQLKGLETSFVVAEHFDITPQHVNKIQRGGVH